MMLRNRQRHIHLARIQPLRPALAGGGGGDVEEGAVRGVGGFDMGVRNPWIRDADSSRHGVCPPSPIANGFGPNCQVNTDYHDCRFVGSRLLSFLHAHECWSRLGCANRGIMEMVGQGVWSCLCNFSMWHRHTPLQCSCPGSCSHRSGHNAGSTFPLGPGREGSTPRHEP